MEGSLCPLMSVAVLPLAKDASGGPSMEPPREASLLAATSVIVGAVARPLTCGRCRLDVTSGGECEWASWNSASERFWGFGGIGLDSGDEDGGITTQRKLRLGRSERRFGSEHLGVVCET